MAPNKDDLKDLSFSYQGLPVTTIGTAGVVTDDLSYSAGGIPVLSPGGDTVITFEDVIDLVDDLNTNTATSGESAPLSESLMVTEIITFTEVLGLVDDSNVPIEFDFDFSIQVGVFAAYDDDFSTRVAVQAAYDIDFSEKVGVIQYTPSPVTDITDPENPFEPTIVVDGEFIVENASTSSGISNPDETCMFIGLKNAGLSNCSLCDLEGFAFSLNEQGGEWSIDSLCSTLGGCNDVVDIYGLRGTIKGYGLKLGGNTAAYTYRGIFGDPNLNRPFRDLVYTSPLGMLLSNQSLYEGSSSFWSTAQAAAQTIASAAGIALQWLTRDVPLTGFKLEEGDTALGALSSLASRVGGKLRWNGNQLWSVVYPDFSQGIWEVPDCNLILPGGLSKDCNCDALALFSTLAATPAPKNTGVINLPTNTVGNPTPPTGGKPPAQLLTKFSKRLTADDPPLIFDLPFDYDKVYAQILVNVGQSVSGNNLVSLHNFMTTDPSAFTEYDASGFGIQYIFVTNIGGTMQPQVRVDHRCLPDTTANNTAIEDGNFVFSLYYTRKPIPVTTNVEETIAKDRETLGLTQDNFRFMKFCSYSIQCLFFGSLPLPGMLGRVRVNNVKVYVPDCLGGYTTVDIGDVVVEGIIESVSFAFPGYLTISLSSYVRLSYYNNAVIDYGPG